MPSAAVPVTGESWRSEALPIGSISAGRAAAEADPILKRIMLTRPVTHLVGYLAMANNPGSRQVSLR
ncbi:hypothetical protein Airi02_093660 [Actinoallomurus iriomotensis]|uniref:Uncharacterized protein n=1 Tax=Actinoallomurus iriomotensis TaxID=478107 RepID=A0A9W6SFT2_9ACTN|nr:hypothetical protein Airi02_093660 [Actinoallomurus iriomotensis]